VDYGLVRRYGHDYFQVENYASELKKAIQGYIQGTQIRTVRGIPRGFALPIREREGDADLGLLDGTWELPEDRLVDLSENNPGPTGPGSWWTRYP